MSSQVKLQAVRKTRALAAGCLIVCVACSGSTPPASSASTPTKDPPGLGDPSLREAYIRSAQQNAGVIYHVKADAEGLAATNPAQSLAIQFRTNGVAIQSPRKAWSWSMTPTTFGCAAKQQPIAAAQPTAQANQVAFSHGDLQEWYLNGPLGLEQGFTIARVLPGCEANAGVQITLQLGGDLHAVASDQEPGTVALRGNDGRTVLRYTDLYARDAQGKRMTAHMRVAGTLLHLEVDDSGATYPIHIDPLVWLDQQKLNASDATSKDMFGTAVALSGDTAVVGAQSVSVGGKVEVGAAYIYVRSGTTWTEQAKLVASDGAANDRFGSAVAISGDTVVIGAVHASLPGIVSPGAAYVFVRAGTTWTQQAKLVASDAADNDAFAVSVAISSDTAVIGAGAAAIAGRPNTGAAYVFVRAGTIWSQQAKLVASDRFMNTYFGLAVALAGDTAIIGSPFGYSTEAGLMYQSGTAYVFVRAGTTWSEQAKLDMPAPVKLTQYGHAVAIAGDTAVIGAPNEGSGVPDTTLGAGYVFVRAGTTWSLQTRLAPAAGGLARLGSSVAISGDTAVIGSPGTYEGMLADTGCIFIFQRSGTTWNGGAQIFLSDAVGFEESGNSVAVDGTTALSAAPFGSAPAKTDTGAVYVYALVPTKAQGSSCGKNLECTSGFCVDGVCCDSACGGGLTTDCQACSAAAGATTTGVCGALAADHVCRPATQICDVAETCDGASFACPPDKVDATMKVCRPAAGPCDMAEQCDGVTVSCPADKLRPASTVCRMAAGACDLAETCSGFQVTCPSDQVKTRGTVCRAAAGPCDIAETCDGTTAACAADVLQPTTLVCRPSAGPCDPAENCNGTDPVCPVNAFLPADAVCRSALGVCDAAELCTGSSALCPGDVFLSKGTPCRPAMGECDAPEVCQGTDSSCPSNFPQADGSACTLGTCQAGACRAEADLSVVVDAATGQVGAALRLDIHMSNAGKSPAQSVQFRLTLPAALHFARSDGSSWMCQSQGQDVVCQRDILAVGSETVSLQLAPPVETGSYSITAALSAQTFDPTTSNNQSTVTVQVQAAPLPPATAPTGCQCNVGGPPAAPFAPTTLGALALVALVRPRRRPHTRRR